MKKLSFFLLITLLLTSFSFSTFGSTNSSFSDVSDTNKNKEAIYFLRDKGIIQGYENNTFRPNTTLNRAELVKILVAGKGISPELVSYSNCFPDVKEEWFAPYICYAKSKNWVSGYPDGNFRPAQTVNKVEALKMLIQSQNLSLPDVSEILFDDVGNAEWFAPYVKIAKDKNLLEETGRMFAPSQEMSRGNISENLFRLLFIQEKKQDRFVKEEQKTENKNVNAQKEIPKEIKNENSAPQNEAKYECSRNTYNCADFNTHQEAQDAMNYCMQKVGKDIHDLDRDADGSACETLP